MVVVHFKQAVTPQNGREANYVELRGVTVHAPGDCRNELLMKAFMIISGEMRRFLLLFDDRQTFAKPRVLVSRFGN